ncbi:MAG: SDR family NAD(P)-dependent oxidoreductase [Propionibacterium sp.]|nr:SDR family NAD(P)-dependent oxidoreductase [Propionibacterium sp.]
MPGGGATGGCARICSTAGRLPTCLTSAAAPGRSPAPPTASASRRRAPPSAKGARLVLLARSVARAEHLLGSWDSDGRAIACDLSDPESVRAAASELDEPIDVLLNNAGTFSSQLRYAAGGHELIWATNFLGPIMLTNLIGSWVRRRIVIAGSEAHRWARLDLADPDCHARRFIGGSGYSRSKLADPVWAALVVPPSGVGRGRTGRAGGPSGLVRDQPPTSSGRRASGQGQRPADAVPD